MALNVAETRAQFPGLPTANTGFPLSSATIAGQVVERTLIPGIRTLTFAVALFVRFPRWALNTKPVPGTARAEPKLMPFVLVVETTFPHLSIATICVVPPWSGVSPFSTFSPVEERVTESLPALAVLILCPTLIYFALSFTAYSLLIKVWVGRL